MPIYEYLCGKCGEFEVTQRITEPALRKCPNCRRSVKKLISSTSFQLRGSGWYVTDYARNGKGKEAKESAPATKSESSSSSDAGASKDSKKTSSTEAAA
jgi:putative FmdB family regulatory protein